MQTVRQPAVAGTFYPLQAQVLSDEVLKLLSAAARTETDSVASASPKALIVPHAGYVYSGATAAQAYAQLSALRSTIKRVVLLGPVHRVPVRGLALPGVNYFSTPLGKIEIDQQAIEVLAALPQVVVSPPAHAHEHSLEVQLPFLQSVLDNFKLLPLAVGDATPAEVAQVLEAVWGGPETLIVISSDLSHFLPYQNAQAIDQATVQHILDLNATITHHQACGGTPVNGLLLAAKQHHLQPHLLGLCNSGDSAGDKDRVVGYAALAFTQGPLMNTNAQDTSDIAPADPGATLLPIARAAISCALGQPRQVPEGAEWLQEEGATFVTLTQHGQLRGCIGTLQAHRSLLADIKANAQAAALHDTRFEPLTLSELDDTHIEVSWLSPMQALHFDSEVHALAQLRPGIDGVVFEFEHYRSTFLPQVWEQLPTPAEFITHLKRKAGLPPNFWANEVRLKRYTVRKWKETRVP